MALLDQQGGANFPYARDDVFDALLEAIPFAGGKVDKHDKAAGLISAKAGVSSEMPALRACTFVGTFGVLSRSEGENVPISVMGASPGFTRVAITSTPKTGLLGGGAFDLCIEKILNRTSELLQTNATPLSVGAKVHDSDPAARI